MNFDAHKCLLYFYKVNVSFEIRNSKSFKTRFIPAKSFSIDDDVSDF
jgi:hypothetical protein